MKEEKTKFPSTGDTVIIETIPHVGMQTMENGYPRLFIPHAQLMELEVGKEYEVKGSMARQDMHWLWITIDIKVYEGDEKVTKQAMFPAHYFNVKDN